MGILRTLFKVLAGITLACLTAALVQVLYVSTPVQLAAVSTSDFPAQASSTLSLVLKAATHFAIFSLPFALIAAGIAEWLGARSLAYWLTIGVGIALLGFFAQYSSEVPGQLTIMNNYALQSFLTAGFFGGLVYWLVAGDAQLRLENRRRLRLPVHASKLKWTRTRSKRARCPSGSRSDARRTPRKRLSPPRQTIRRPDRLLRHRRA